MAKSHSLLAATLARTTLKRTTLFLLAAATAWMVAQALRQAGGLDGQLGRYDILRGIAEPYWLLLPGLAVLAGGTDPAADRERGLLQLYLSRGVRRGHLVAAQVVVGTLAACLVTAAPFVAAALVLWRRAPAVGTAGARAAVPPGLADAMPGLAWLVLAIVAMALLSVLGATVIGMLTRSRYFAVAGVAVGVLVFEIGLPASLEGIKMTHYLRLEPSYPVSVGQFAAYWVSMATVLAVLTAALVAREGRR